MIFDWQRPIACLLTLFKSGAEMLKKKLCLFIQSAHLVCRRGMVQCEGESPRRRCIATQWFCDGYDHCGNNWDEDPAVCGEFSCLFVCLMICPWVELMTDYMWRKKLMFVCLISDSRVSSRISAMRGWVAETALCSSSLVLWRLEPVWKLLGRGSCSVWWVLLFAWLEKPRYLAKVFRVFLKVFKVFF